MEPHSHRLRRVVVVVSVVLAAASGAQAAGTAGSAGSTYEAQRPVVTGTAGDLYRASASIRARKRGQRVCLQLRETVGGSRIAGATRCRRATRRWQRIQLSDYRAHRTGSKLRLAISRHGGRGARLGIRRLSLTPLGRRPCKTNCAPSPVIPPGPPLGDALLRPGLAVGSQFHCNWAFYTDPERTAVLDKLAAAGATWVRIDTSWSGIENTGKGARNTWYIAMVDFCVNEARARGLNVLVTLWLTPSWANGGRGERVPPTNPQDYADFARWATTYWRGRVAAWEVWNEPDPTQSFWQGTIDEYVELLRAAYPAFKAGDPQAQVVLGGPSSNDDGWIRQVYARGAKDSFDVLATHPYQGIADAPPERPDDGHRWWFTHLPVVRQVMLDYGDAAKPIWFTEFGWSAHANQPGIPDWLRGVTPEQQGDYFIRALEYTRKNYPYVRVAIWYKERARPGDELHQDGFGILNSDLSERPAYWRLKTYLTG